MGETRDLLMQSYGIKKDEKTDEQIYEELLVEKAKKGKLPKGLEDTYKKVMENTEKNSTENK